MNLPKSVQNHYKKSSGQLQQSLLITNYEKIWIWKRFFILRSKPEFIKQWSTFLKTAGKPVKPVPFQHLTDVIFRKYLSNHIQVVYLQQQSESKGIELRESEMVCYIMLQVTSVDTCSRILKEEAISSRKKRFCV